MLLIKNGTIVNPAKHQHEVGDILVENGKITEDEFSGGFVGFKYLDTIADPCV